MKVLITGSSGEIGTNLALRLLKEGFDVLGVDRRANTWTNSIPTVIQDLAGTYSDFSEGIGELAYPSDIDLVVHLAANAKVHELVLKPERALKNINITFNVLEFCRARNLPIIFSSSREVYGDIHRYIAGATENSAITPAEMHAAFAVASDEPLRAHQATREAHTHISLTESTYSASKIAGEALVYAYAKCYGIPYLVFRFSNVYGRYDNDIERMERVIPLFIKKIAADEPITIYGKDKTLDFTYVDDCVDGIFRGVKALSSGTVKNETINLAFGQGHTLLQMTDYIAASLGKKPDITIEPPRVGEVTRYIADISKAKKLLGYMPTVSLREGIKRAVEWNKEWQKQNSHAPLPHHSRL